MYYIIDRFEDDIVVLEMQDGKHKKILKKDVPTTAKEGDCLILQNGVYSVSEELTKKKRSEAFKLQESLWK